MNGARALLAALLWCALVASALADEIRPGYLEFTQTTSTEWRMLWKAPVQGGLAGASEPSLPEICQSSEPQRELVESALVSVWSVSCAGGLDGERVGLTGLDTTLSDALVRIAPLGRPVQVERLTPDRPMVEVLARPDRWQVARAYLRLGIEHIVFGFDHLLFVLALVLLLAGAWTIAKTVTAFTVAHSLTLVATTLGWVSVPAAPVESVIALSIVFVAVEIVKARPGEQRLSERFPWVVAFIFGLLHGFGFASALRQIGIPEGEAPMALFTFNLGVEIGQLLIVAAALAALALIRRYAQALMRPTQITAAYCIGGLASAWFLERTFL
jgi:hydrogenase/urease accessory protein HupE